MILGKGCIAAMYAFTTLRGHRSEHRLTLLSAGHKVAMVDKNFHFPLALTAAEQIIAALAGERPYLTPSEPG